MAKEVGAGDGWWSVVGASRGRDSFFWICGISFESVLLCSKLPVRSDEEQYLYSVYLRSRSSGGCWLRSSSSVRWNLG